MEKNLNKIKEMAHQKENENEEFRMYLKWHDHFKVDQIVHKLNEKYMAEFDCTECANCCKKLTPTLTHEEIREIATFLNIDYEKFIIKYVEREIAEGIILKGSECPFIENNRCSIYDCRPEICRSFPHLHKENINHRFINIIDNSYVCPIVYNLLEDLKCMFSPNITE